MRLLVVVEGTTDKQSGRLARGQEATKRTNQELAARQWGGPQRQRQLRGAGSRAASSGRAPGVCGQLALFGHQPPACPCCALGGDGLI